MTPSRLVVLIMTIREVGAAALPDRASLPYTAAASAAGVGRVLRSACSGRVGGTA